MNKVPRLLMFLGILWCVSEIARRFERCEPPPKVVPNDANKNTALSPKVVPKEAEVLSVLPKHDGCHFLVFANGGKCGSTAMYVYLEQLLKDYIQPTTGKEKCWKKPPSITCTNPFVLDGCPSRWAQRVHHWKKDYVTAILLVRKQEDRIQSLFNDALSSPPISNLQSAVKSQLAHPENNFTKTLELSEGMRVVVVHHDELLSSSGVVSVVKRITGIDVMSPRPIHPNRATQKDSRHRDMHIPVSLKQAIAEHFEKTNCDFYHRTGTYISGDDCLAHS